jgi:RNA polymerase sigma-70 factor (ECF subfamily)
VLHALIERARDGDADAFSAAIEDSLDRLYGAAYLVLRDRHAAEDAVQDGLLRAWKRLPTLRDASRFDAWVRRIVMHAAIDAARRRRPTLELGGEIEDAGTAGDLEARSVIGDGFGQLPPAHRAVLVLRYYLDLTVPEIAATLEIPEGTAKSRLHHATRGLRAALAEIDPELGVVRG